MEQGWFCTMISRDGRQVPAVPLQVLMQLAEAAAVQQDINHLGAATGPILNVKVAIGTPPARGQVLKTCVPIVSYG